MEYNKKILEVPFGIRYISDWDKLQDGYHLCDYPYPHIVNKKITGCGFTEYCITNRFDTIICSPRRILLENKEDQHEGDVLYFKNELIEEKINFDKDILGKGKKSIKKVNEAEAETEEIENFIMSEGKMHINVNKLTGITEDKMFLKVAYMKKQLMSYIDSRRAYGLPVKILVTYDSFKYIRQFLGDKELNNFQIVIDEFQSVFVDSRFKSTTEMDFLDTLAGLNKVCYVSATPMIEEYLCQIDEFKDLPYIEFDWKSKDPCRVVKPNLIIKSSKCLTSSAIEVLNDYLSGNFEVALSKDPQTGEIKEIVSNEVVLYFNSVKNICSLIKKCGLTPDNTNVLCSNTKENRAQVRSAFKSSCGMRGDIGTVPKRGEKHKMITLCTRTVYLGADFYSTCAKSFVFSDPNLDCLSVDISLDLPQILGRQRLLENPWRNSATVYYKKLDGNKTLEDYLALIEEKINKTNDLLGLYERINGREQNSLIGTLNVCAKLSNYTEQYVAVNKIYDGEERLVPVFNKLVMLSERRAYDIQCTDYKDRFTVISAISNSFDGYEASKLEEVLAEFDKVTGLSDKLRFICTINLPDREMEAFLANTPIDLRNYYLVLGPDRCKANGYRLSRIKEEFELIVKGEDSSISSLVYSFFEVDRTYLNKDIKEFFKKVYEETDMNVTPKATDLEKFFNIKSVLIRNRSSEGSSKVERGIKILSKKE